MTQKQNPPGKVMPGRAKPTKARWTILVLVFIGLAINYIDRANLSVALPEMEKDLGIGAAATGVILGAFYWTYSIAQIPIGRFVDKLGSRVVFAFAAAWWSVCTALTALANGFASLFGLRLLLGLGEAGAFPSSVKAISAWFPNKERGIATGIYISGARAGTLLSVPIVAVLIGWLGWKGSFIVTGAIGVVWAIVWYLYYRNPRQHSRVNEAELAYIEQDQEDAAHAEPLKISWTKLVSQRNVLMVSIGYFCLTFVEYFFITWFPSYLVQERGFNLLEVGIYGSIPAICALLGQWFGGYMADALRRRGVGLTMARKGCIIAGSLGSAVIALAAIANSPVAAVALLSVSVAAATFADASIWCLPADLSPNGHGTEDSWEGSIAGVVNGISNLAGIASPIVVGFVVQSTGSFVGGMVIAGVVSILAVLVFAFGVGKVEPIKMNGVATTPVGTLR